MHGIAFLFHFCFCCFLLLVCISSGTVFLDSWNFHLHEYIWGYRRYFYGIFLFRV